MYAVVETGGKQYRVAAGDKLEIEKLPVDAGQSYIFDKVLMIGDGDTVKVGAPLIEGASVEATVVDQIKGKKVIAFKFKRRKGYRLKKGHRRRLSVVEIKEIKTA